MAFEDTVRSVREFDLAILILTISAPGPFRLRYLFECCY